MIIKPFNFDVQHSFLPLLIILCIVLLLLPSLNAISYYNPTITSKTIFFSYGLMAVLGVVAIQVLFSNKIGYQFKVVKVDIVLLLLLTFIAINRYFIQSDYGFSLRFIELLGLSFLYIILRFIPLKYYPWLLFAIICSGILQSVYGGLQLFGYFPSLHPGFKMTGSFFNPGPYAGYLAVVFVLSLGMYLYQEKIVALIFGRKDAKSNHKDKLLTTFFKYVPLTGVVTIMIILPALRSRAALLATVAGTIFLLSFQYEIVKKFKGLGTGKKTFFIFISTLILFIGLYGIYIYKKDSADGRMLIWKITSTIIADNPIFGVGFDRFKAHYMDAQAEYFNKYMNSGEVMFADNTNYAFNGFLQFTAENRLVGLLMLTVFGIFLIRGKEGNKAYNFFKITCLGVVLTILSFALFSYPAQILPIKVVLVFSLALIAGIGKGKCPLILAKQTNTFFVQNDKFIKTGFAMMVLVLAPLIFVGIERLQSGYKNWSKANIFYSYGLYEDSITEFKMAYPIFKANGGFLMQYGKALVMEGRHKEALPILRDAKKYFNSTIVETALGDAYKGLGDYQRAERSYQKAENMIPNRFYAQYLLAKLYDETGQNEKAVRKAKSLLEKEVKIPSRAIEEIKVEMMEIINKIPKQIKENPPGANVG